MCYGTFKYCHDKWEFTEIWRKSIDVYKIKNILKLSYSIKYQVFKTYRILLIKITKFQSTISVNDCLPNIPFKITEPYIN